jgi:hypothetical protein
MLIWSILAIAAAVVTANVVAVVNYIFYFIGAVPTKDSDEQPQNMEHQQQSTSPASVSQIEWEDFEVAKGYIWFVAYRNAAISTGFSHIYCQV